MLAFIGLGNVGHEYKRTKHNAGFWVVDEFSRRKNLVFNPGEGEYVFTKTTAKEVLLIKPTTGMNRSGSAVKSIVEKWDLVFSDIYIIIDDVDLPLGKIRIRPKGGDGCHRGLENIIYHTTPSLRVCWSKCACVNVCCNNPFIVSTGKSNTGIILNIFSALYKR